MGVGSVSVSVWPEPEPGLASLPSLASTLRLVGLATAILSLFKTNKVRNDEVRYISYILSRLSATEMSLSVSLLELCARLRSIRIFLQMSLRALAIVRAGTWHLSPV